MLEILASLSGSLGDKSSAGGEAATMGNDSSVDSVTEYLAKLPDKLAIASREAADRAAAIVAEEVTVAIEDSGAVASGNLLRSVTVDVGQSSSEYYSVSVTSSMPYAGIVESGRAPGGKMPPLQEILQWMQLKGIDPSVHVAYLIARKIAEKGIEGKHVFEAGLEQAENRIDEEKIVGIIAESIVP